MYTEFFKLHTRPFDLVPDPDFLFPSSTHKRAISYLDYGIRERLGFILLTGEVGAGKTTLVQTIIKSLDRSVSVARIFNTRVSFEQLLMMICNEFDIPVQDKDRDKVFLLKKIYDFLIQLFAQGQHAILIIDEAQNFDSSLLEDLRMLSNLETGKAKLLQIILVGQPELKQKLALPELRQLQQRISIACHLHPLSREETEQYIYHRLDKAGNRDCVWFNPQAISLIRDHTRGIPRLINTMCDFLLLSAYAEQVTEINEDMVRDIAQDMDVENRCWGVTVEDRTLPVQDEMPVAVGVPNALGGADVNPAGGIKGLNEGAEAVRVQAQMNPIATQDTQVLVDRIEQLEQRMNEQTSLIESTLAELRNVLNAVQSSSTSRERSLERNHEAQSPALNAEGASAPQGDDKLFPRLKRFFV
ncbi:MAG TPA: XrtA/PEP-CTERM system-associated ATPase [Dissulfurispiraceae bacterium]|nr:XrtA/PEP-CTERM system-associated ATPase [Dissulfurispiraceae bacterium]